MNNEIRIKISGLNLARIINYLIDNKVVLNNVVLKNKSVVFSIQKNNLVWLDKICRFEHKKYRIIHRYGIVNFISQVPHYFGAVLALILVVSYLLSFNFTIFKISVFNDSKIDYDMTKVNGVLAENGIVVGVSKLKYKKSEIEDILINNLDDISGCSVSFEGSYLNIKVYPSSKKYEINQTGLYSKFDAIVNSVDVYSGVSECKVGQIVKTGDLLIESDDGASGEIKGKVYFSSSKLYNKKQEKIVYSGKYEVLRNVYFYNKNLIKTEKQCSFLNYSTKKCDFYLTNNYFLPIKIEEIYCFEYSVVEEIIEFETVEDKLKGELYQETLLKVPNDAEIVGCSYSVVVEGDYTRIDCFIETIVDLI